MTTKTTEPHSNANTSGLEVVAYSWEQHIAGAHWSWRLDRHQPNHSPEKRNPSIRNYEPLVTAASAQARIVELERDRTELARIADEWTTEAHERGNKLIATEDCAIDALERAEAAEARADRLAKVLRKSREGWANALELGLLPPQHEETAADLRDEADDALQQETQP